VGTPLHWLRRYRREDLVVDVVAGLTVAALLVPQTMAYARAAGFPAVVGLWSCVVPLLAYAVLGRSPVLAIGPLISTNLVVASGAARVGDAGGDAFVAAAATTALLTGVILVAAWLTGVARLAGRTSDAALDGYLLAVAVVIVLSQLDALFGLDERHLDPLGTALAVAEGLGQAKWVGVGIGAATVVVLVATASRPRFPGALVAVVVGCLLTGVAGVGPGSVEVLGSVPSGLPAPQLPSVDHVVTLLPTAVVVALLVLVGVTALERRFAGAAEPTGEEAGGRSVDDRRSSSDGVVDSPSDVPASEGAVLGLANLVSSVFRGLPVVAVPTRTAVGVAAGARTQLTGVVTAVAVAVVLAVGTGLIRWLPLPVLAAVAIVAATAFFRIPLWRRRWHDDRPAFVVGLAVAAVTVTVGFELGAVAVVVASIVLHRWPRRSGPAGG